MTDHSPETRYPHEILVEIIRGAGIFLNEKVLLGFFFEMISVTMAIIILFVECGIVSLDTILISGKIGIIYIHPPPEWTWKFINTGAVYLTVLDLSLFVYGLIMIVSGPITKDESKPVSGYSGSDKR